MDKKPKRSETEKQIIYGQPETTSELLHKYGTYEIQPTLDSDNEFPKIGTGLPKTPQNDA